jgi:transcriptional regulator with XRE-family HTH domain
MAKSPVAKNLLRLRRAAGLTQHELANLSGVSRSTIAVLELDRRDNPNSETLRRLAAAVGVPASTFFSGSRKAVRT